MRAATLSVTIVLICSARMASAQLEPSCVENSPERRGEIGCSLVENKRLPPDPKAPRGNGARAAPSVGGDRLRRLAAANDEDGGEAAPKLMSCK